MDIAKAIKKAVEWRHAGSWPLAIGIIVGTGMWYVGDTEITGMPPHWILMVSMVAVSILLNDFAEALNVEPDSESGDSGGN